MPLNRESHLPLEDQAASAILALGGIEEHLGPRGPYFTVGSRTIAYTADDHVIETRLPSSVVEELRPRLAAKPNVLLRKKGSRWVGVRLREPADVELVAHLATKAVLAARTNR